MVKKKKDGAVKKQQKKLKRAKKLSQVAAKHQSLLIENRYPKFIYEDYDETLVDAGFVQAVKSILRDFNFATTKILSRAGRSFYKLMKEEGYLKASARLQDAVPDEKKSLALSLYNLKIGEFLYQELDKRNDLKKYLPVHDCFLAPKQDFHIHFYALKKMHTPQGFGYYSPKEPKVAINGKDYKVSFSRHAMERIGERCVSNPLSYSGAGDVFAYLSHCSYFEYVEIEKDGNPFPAITFYDNCTKGFVSYDYVKYLVQSPGFGMKYYYRLGYCPVAIYKDFARAITFLTPGMRGTPEEKLVNKINEPALRQQLQTGVQNITSLKRYVETEDFSAPKYFHENGISQLLELKKDLYDYSQLRS